MTLTNSDSDGLEQILCLVTDKKYRKMGGMEGLQRSLEALDLGHRYTVDQVRIEDWLEEGRRSDLKEFLTDKLSKASAIVHKHTDYFKMMEGKQVLRVRSYLSGLVEAGRVKVLDDPRNIEVLSSRWETGDLIQKFCRERGFEGRGLQWPKFEMKWTGEMDLPVILKPVEACATDDSHWMTLINDEAFNFCGHDDGATAFPRSEVLIQKFYEHFGVLYKVYVIGDVIEIVARPSISSKNTGPVLRFNTHKFKASEGELQADEARQAMGRIEPLRELIEEFSAALRSRLGLTWFGIDVIIPENCSHVRAAVIDINYMPGYDGIQNLSEKLIKAILK